MLAPLGTRAPVQLTGMPTSVRCPSQALICACTNNQFSKLSEAAATTLCTCLPQMDSSMDKETARYEIAGMREWAQESCGIPASQILGFRNP